MLNGHVGALTDHYPLQGQCRRDRQDIFWCWRPELHLVIPRHRRDFSTRSSDGLSNKPSDYRTFRASPFLPGGATIVEFKCEVPGRYVLVDHALSRAERGLAGYLIVEGGS